MGDLAVGWWLDRVVLEVFSNLSGCMGKHGHGRNESMTCACLVGWFY